MLISGPSVLPAAEERAAVGARDGRAHYAHHPPELEEAGAAAALHRICALLVRVLPRLEVCAMDRRGQRAPRARALRLVLRQV